MNTIVALPTWVQEARKSPVYFCQVREDALVDLAVARLLDKTLKVIMVASGGCTAAALAGTGLLSDLHMVDLNASQLALTKLKLDLLNRTNQEERLNILGYTKNKFTSNDYCLDTWLKENNLNHETFGDRDIINQLGLDFSGRYEQLFSQLRHALQAHQKDLDILLALDEPAQQINYIDHTNLRNALKEAFDKVMALPNLIALFGEAATGNRRISFSEHFFERTINILSTQPARTNPYLQSVLLVKGNKRTVSPWIEMPAPDKMPNLSYLESSMLSTLSQSSIKYDLIHLSNICDWLKEEEAKELLIQCHCKLNSGGMVIIRQLNSSLDIPMLFDKFDWQTQLSESLLNKDRSFFYRSLYIGRKAW